MPFICLTFYIGIFQDDGWKLNRTNYYQEGWLATGNIRGIVGVTFTTSHCKKNMDYPLRTNYNLRGHRSDVSDIFNPKENLADANIWTIIETIINFRCTNSFDTLVWMFGMGGMWDHEPKGRLKYFKTKFTAVKLP